MLARNNPFRVDRVARWRYRLDRAGWDELDRRLAALGGRGAIVGPKGTGKTTLLEDWAARLAGAGWTLHWIRFREDCRRLPLGWDARWRSGAGGAAPTTAVLLDGVEQLTWWRWRLLRWYVQRAGLVIATAHAPGWLPTVWECRPQVEVLRGLIDDLLADAPTEVAASVADLRAGLPRLLATAHGNFRTVLGQFYDRVAVG